MTAFKRTSQSLCTGLAVAWIAASVALPAGAQPLSTRLDERSLASGLPRSREFYQWPAPRKPGTRKTGDLVVSDSSKRGPLSLIILGAGVASGGVGVFFGLRNASAKTDYRNAQTATARSSARDRSQSAATVANVSWIASGVLLAAGLGVLFFTDL